MILYEQYTWYTWCTVVVKSEENHNKIILVITESSGV